MLPALQHIGCTWHKDVPYCAWERLFDWGYCRETAEIGHVLVACEAILQLIKDKDDYYFLEFDDMPMLIGGLMADAQGFISKYGEFAGLGIE